MSYSTILTTLGQAKLATALANGTGVAISSLAVGDGNGAAVTPLASMTALVREKHRVSVQSVVTDPQNPSYIIVEAVIPSTVGGWTIREAGLFDSDDQLFAVANFPDTVKPLLAEGSARDLVIRIVIEVANASAVQLLIDPSVVLASQAWVLQQAFVKKSGDTMTGPLTLAGNATQNLHAVPKQQLDAAIAAVNLSSRVAKSGDTMTGPLTLPGDPTDSFHAATKNYVDAARGIDSVPIGEVTWFAASTAPTSFLVCDGSAVSRTTYNVLFARIGTLYGAGDGSTTFNLPDLRGEFLRGWDNRSTGGADNGRVFGSKQSASGLGHIGTDASSNQLAMSVDQVENNTYEAYSYPGRLDSGQAGTATQKRWRIRPRNVAMLPCIKARLLTSVDIALMQQAQAMYLPLSGGTINGDLSVLNGNVGIGVSASGNFGAKLVVAGSVAAASISANANTASAQLDYDGTGSRLFAYSSTGSYQTFWTNSSGEEVTERMRIDASGNVGIGTNSPAAKLEVAGNVKCSDPTAAAHAATKSYVDGLTSGKLAVSDFTGSNQSLAAPGYQKLPGGLIIQWGYLSGTNNTFNFNVTFPNAALIVSASNANSQGGQVDNAFAYIVSNSQFFCATKASNNGALSGYACYWFAIGY